MAGESEPVLIWGAGAIGGTIGAFLTRAGFDVTLVDAVAGHVDAMNAKGLTITGPIDAFTIPVRAVTPDRVRGTWRCVLLCVKGQDTRTATGMIKPHLAADGYVASIQNGLNEAAIAAIVGPQRTIGAFINFDADYHGPGEIHFAGRSSVVVGEIDGVMRPRVRELAAMLQRFEPDAIATGNIQGFLWSKLAYLSLLWANVLVEAELPEVFGSTTYRPLLTGLTREVIRIAERRGIALEAFDPFDPRGFVSGATAADTERGFERLVENRVKSAKKHSGMWRDIAVRKRKTEADTLLVPMLEAAQAEGIATPLNSAMLSMVRELESGTRRQGWNNFDELAALMR